MKGEADLPVAETPILRVAPQDNNLVELTAAPGTLDAIGGK